MHKRVRNVLAAVFLLTVGAFYLIHHFTQPYAGWTHLELGAGNYGEEGHTKVSQHKTVLMKLQVSDKPNYVDELPVKDEKPYAPMQQFAILFWTLDEIVKRHGPKVVFHVNDLIPEYSETAVQALKKYAEDKGYHEVIIESVPGDYATLNIQNSLSKYRLHQYDSVHLKNPEISFFSYALDGDDVLDNETSRAQARTLLQKLANYSKEGLFFFPINHKNFIPVAETEEYIKQAKFYQPTTVWPPVAYYFPEGPTIPETHGAVFFIKASDKVLSHKCA